MSRTTVWLKRKYEGKRVRLLKPLRMRTGDELPAGAVFTVQSIWRNRVTLYVGSGTRRTSRQNVEIVEETWPQQVGAVLIAIGCPK